MTKKDTIIIIAFGVVCIIIFVIMSSISAISVKREVEVCKSKGLEYRTGFLDAWCLESRGDDKYIEYDVVCSYWSFFTCEEHKLIWRVGE